MKTSIYRKEHFNAAHRLHNSSWMDKKNKTVFGKCNNPNFHGHNYELIIKLTGNIDENTGYVYDTKKLSELIKAHIINKFDHKNLNLDVAELRHLNPTTENIARVIWNILRKEINKKYQLKITLYETERNFVEYPGE